MAELTVTPIVALDVRAMADALAVVDVLGDSCSFYKVGSELFTAEGPAVVEALRRRGAEVFLDLKFHDIPTTVAGAVRSAARLGVRLLTVHLTGGPAMLEAAALAAAEAGAARSERCRVLGVSILTSMDAVALGAAWGRTNLDVGSEVVRLARLARDTGLAGLVCSAHEAGSVAREHGAALELLIPGIRLSGASLDDQARAATPSAAARAGARYIVLGRTVTAAADPRAAMALVLSELRAAARDSGNPTTARP